MDVRVLKYFLAVAREENITRAAERLHIAQPSLSKQLMELEAELGKKLLIRGKRKISLTEDGILLRKRAEEIVELFDRTAEELKSDGGEISGEVAIGGGPTPAVTYAAARLREKYPRIRFRFFAGEAADVTERLDHGSLDFAALISPVDVLKYEYLSLGDTTEWGLLMKKDSPYASEERIMSGMLHDIPLIMHQRQGLQRELAMWAGREIEQLNIAATFNVIHGSVSDYVSSGLGSALIPASFVKAEDKELIFRPLDPPSVISYALVWKRHAVFSRAASAFLEEIKEIEK